MGSLQLPFSRVEDRRFAIVDAKRVAAGRRTYAAGAIWENRKRVPMGLRKRLCWSVLGAEEGGRGPDDWQRGTTERKTSVCCRGSSGETK